MNADLRDVACAQLRSALGNPLAEFRNEQWEAIDALANRRERLLLVQRTGWGKSVVYFIATSLLRQAGAGPTLIISPLLALMRNQLDAARNLGLRAERIDSSNQDELGEWERIYDLIGKDEVDVLMVSPERLVNERFQREAGLALFARLGMLVVDEAHCISDWGHDFRPQYRRIASFARFLPTNIPMLATTATADERVTADVRAQLGEGIRVVRGTLGRDSLKLDSLSGMSYAERLAWIAESLPLLPGSGIIYAATQRDCDLISRWLASRGIDAPSYHGAVASDVRENLEARLLNDDVKALVATSALGMGFDKPNLAFVIHFASTQSIVHYYQQVGRAGRAISESVGVLLGGSEDDDIFTYFVENALPSPELIDGILTALGESADGLSVTSLTSTLNAKQSKINAALEYLGLQTPSPIAKIETRWARTAVPFEFPVDKTRELSERRATDRAAMVAYANADSCLMRQLSIALGDAEAVECGRCSFCTGEPIVDPGDINEITEVAEDFLNHQDVLLAPRKQWPFGGLPTFGFESNRRIGAELLASDGRAIALYNVGANGRRISREKYVDNHFSEDTVRIAAEVIQAWSPQPPARWIVPMVSGRHPDLVPDFAERLGRALGIPCVRALKATRPTEPQKEMENSSFRARNLDGSLEVIPFEGMSEPGMLVDDMYDSGWTMTIAAALLRAAGSGIVHPFALAKASGTT